MPTRSIVYRAMASFCAKRSPKFILVVIRQLTNGVLTFCDTQLAHQFISHVQQSAAYRLPTVSRQSTAESLLGLNDDTYVRGLLWSLVCLSCCRRDRASNQLAGYLRFQISPVATKFSNFASHILKIDLG
jgi:hypothetical protein